MKIFAIWTAFSKTKAEDAAQRKRALNAVLISLAVHIVLLIGAVSLTIMIIAPKPKMMFEGKKSPSLPARKLEHAIRVKQMQKQTRKPQILQRLVTEAPSKVALPEMPEMKTPDIKNLRDTPLMNTRAGSIGGLGGAGGGAGRGLTGGLGYSDTKFFGENVRTRAIIVLIDVTTTVFNIGAIEALKKEAATMLATLNPNTKFNLIVYVDGAGAYQPQMVYALEEHKKGAMDFLNSLIENDRRGNNPGTGGTSSKMAIEMAAEMGADTVFIITDGDLPKVQVTRAGGLKDEAALAQLKPVWSVPPGYVPGHAESIVEFVRTIESRYGRPMRIHPVVFYPSRDPEWNLSKEFYRKLAGLTGGKLKVIE